LGLVHHRLAVIMALAGLLAYAGGAGMEFTNGAVAAALLVISLFWRPAPQAVVRMERLWLPLALLLVGRALYHGIVLRDDLVLPVVDLLLLLLVAEAFRPSENQNDGRLYALTFALLLAATAYRPGLLYAVGFGLYVLLAVPTFMVGHLKREAARYAVRPPALGRAFVLRGMLASGGILLSAVAVFALFPRASRAWTGRDAGPVASVAGFRDQVALGAHGSTIQSNPAVVLRVEFPDGTPPAGGLYWRGRSYDRFDGQVWSRTSGMPPSAPPTSWVESAWSGEPVSQLIYAAPLDVRVLFALHPLIRIRPESPIQAVFDNAGDYYYWGTRGPVYRALSGRTPPDAERLRRGEGAFHPADDRYLQLPQFSDPRIGVLADSVVGDADNAYDRASRLVTWFHQNFEYTLELPATPQDATLERFLFARRAGHCEYFSTALAIMLRTVGIHAREVNGFLGGTWNEFGSYLAVSQNEAHSWVEVWIPGYGWTLFDPTPPGISSSPTRTAWNWPGRFLLDGLRHRWNKWVLDYDAGVQLSLLDGMRADPDEVAGSPSGATGGSFSTALLWLVGVGGAWSLWILGRGLQRRRTTHRPESLLFERIRAEYARAGVGGATTLAPAALARAVRRAALPGAEETAEFVALYLRARFSGQKLAADEWTRMDRAGRAARRLVRRAPSRHHRV